MQDAPLTPIDFSMQLRSGTLTDFASSSRKRARCSQDVTALTPPKRARLTKDNLKAHAAAMGRRKNQSVPSISTNTSFSTITTTSNRFPDQLQSNGIIHKQSKVIPPTDAADVRAYLDRPRASQSPSTASWEEYRRSVEVQDNEASMRGEVWCGGLVKKQPFDTHLYCAVHDLSWPEAAEANPNLTNRLCPPKPDYYEGYRLERYPNHAVDALGGHLAPASYGGAMPSFAAEVKRRQISIDTAQQQAAYDGSIMASAARATQKHLQRPSPSETTEALTASYNGRDLTIQAHHIRERDKEQPEYHSYQLYSHQPATSLEEYKASWRHVRNAQDWGRERATRYLDDLRAHVPMPHLPTPPHSSNSGNPVMVTPPAPSGPPANLPPPPPSTAAPPSDSGSSCNPVMAEAPAKPPPSSTAALPSHSPLSGNRNMAPPPVPAIAPAEPPPPPSSSGPTWHWSVEHRHWYRYHSDGTLERASPASTVEPSRRPAKVPRA